MVAFWLNVIARHSAPFSFNEFEQKLNLKKIEILLTLIYQKGNQTKILVKYENEIKKKKGKAEIENSRVELRFLQARQPRFGSYISNFKEAHFFDK